MVQMHVTVPHPQQDPALSRLRAAKDLAAARDRPFAARRRDTGWLFNRSSTIRPNWTLPWPIVTIDMLSQMKTS